MATSDSRGPQGLADPLADELRKYFAASIIPFVRDSAAAAALNAVGDYVERLSAEQARLSGHVDASVERLRSEQATLAGRVDSGLKAVDAEVRHLRTETEKLETASNALERKRQEIDAALHKVREETETAHAMLEAQEAAAARAAAARAGEPAPARGDHDEELAELLAAVRTLIAASPSLAREEAPREPPEEAPPPAFDEAALDETVDDEAAPREAAGDGSPIGDRPDEEGLGDGSGDRESGAFARFFVRKARTEAEREEAQRRVAPRWMALLPQYGLAVAALVLGLVLSPWLFPPRAAKQPNVIASTRVGADPAAAAAAARAIESGWKVVREQAPSSVCTGAGTCDTFASAWSQDVVARPERIRILQFLLAQITAPGAQCGDNAASPPPATGPIDAPPPVRFDGLWGPNLVTALKGVGECLQDRKLRDAKATEPPPQELRAYAETLLKALGQTIG
ncbi:MAG: hypothetical protein JOZ90_16215 [Alphaproteobacteria bacterium]|nr:hypothetical protein [Alphaproteobacteria bacterium]MBV9371998.1 hypothetical protein [Alphaproteobacteria bacterium]MBV9902617.1 hypothetical protein [Alphaproteobacteria bacterium]